MKYATPDIIKGMDRISEVYQRYLHPPILLTDNLAEVRDFLKTGRYRGSVDYSDHLKQLPYRIFRKLLGNTIIWIYNIPIDKFISDPLKIKIGEGENSFIVQPSSEKRISEQALHKK